MMNERSELECELSAIRERYRAALTDLVAREKTYVREALATAEELEWQGHAETAQAFRWLARDVRVQILKHEALAPTLGQDLAAWAAMLARATRGSRRPA